MATEPPEAEFARARLAYISAGLRAPATEPTSDVVAREPGREPDQTSVPARIRRWERPGPRHVLVVLLLLLVGVGVTVAALTRSQASEVPLLPEVVAPTDPPSAAAAPTPAPSQPVLIRVHVLGAVARPGVVQLTEGSIVADALAAAGGLAAGADPGELNLAARLADGQQIIVGTAGQPRGEVRGSPGDEAGGGAGGAQGKVNLNTADGPRLEELPGVGPVLAAAIIAWREDNGGFKQVSDLRSVPGIGPKTFATLEPLVTL